MKIAIQGHPTRGKEVIQILESLGGKNIHGFCGNGKDPVYHYHIDDCGIIAFSSKGDLCNHKFYTLAKFEKEFPFKIGDIVQTKPCGEPAKVIRLYPNPACIIAYKVRYKSGKEMQYCPENIKFYKEMKEERNITLTLEKAKEWYKKGGELKEIALQAYSEEELTKAELPKSWKEYCVNYPIKEGEYYIDLCSDIILASSGPNEERGIEMDRNICPSKESAEAHLALIQLEQLRDCYRGLFVTVIGMPVWCIIRHKGRLVITQRIWGTNETFLSFQSPEIAEKYLKNFESLIKQAGDLI